MWLGRRGTESITATAAYHPLQVASADRFRIPPAGMQELQERLRQDRAMVAAQVHTHPMEAFHSEADDRWAIVRHEGALSLVLPRFGLSTDLSSFAHDCKVFRLSAESKWCELRGKEVSECMLLS